MIVYVSSDVLCYRDESGEEIIVNFKTCNENWMKYKHRVNYSDKNPDVIVGQRDICSKPCFIELFTKPFTRITFDGVDASDRFRYWNEEIQKAGWATIDLS